MRAGRWCIFFCAVTGAHKERVFEVTADTSGIASIVQDGYMISSGHPVNDYIDGAVRHVMLRQGVLGIKVRRMQQIADQFTSQHTKL